MAGTSCVLCAVNVFSPSRMEGVVFKTSFILSRLTAPRWIMFTIKPAPISGHISIDRYLNIATRLPAVIKPFITRRPPTPSMIRTVRPERKVIKGKKKPNRRTSSMLAFW